MCDGKKKFCHAAEPMTHDRGKWVTAGRPVKAGAGSDGVYC